MREGERGRGRENEWERDRERRNRIPSRLHDVRAELNMELKPTDREIMT